VLSKVRQAWPVRPGQPVRADDEERRQGPCPFPKAAGRRVVLNHRHTHTPAALSAAFPPAEAWRIVRTWDFHAPPQHGRWLHMAAFECAMGSTPGVDRCLGYPARVCCVITAWDTGRHAARATVNWHVTTAQARRKRTRLYP